MCSTERKHLTRLPAAESPDNPKARARLNPSPLEIKDMQNLNERFSVIPEIVAAGNTQYSAAGATTTDVTESTVKVPDKPPAGLTYRFKLSGTKTGANAAQVIHLKLGATQVASLTADAGAAVDWVAEFTIRFTNPTNQKIMGTLLEDTADAEAAYTAGTVDCSAGAPLLVQVQSANASDTVTCEMVTVERWIL